jgi:hypothetical protein
MRFTKHDSFGVSTELAPVPNNFAVLSYSPADDRALLFDGTEYYNELLLVSLFDQKVDSMSKVGLPAWFTDGDSYLIYVPGDQDQGGTIWMPGSFSEFTDLPVEDGMSLEGYTFAASADGTWIALQTDQAIDIWHRDNKLQKVAQIPGGYGAEWKNDVPTIFFYNQQNILCWADASTQWTSTCPSESIHYPAGLSDDGRSIIFFSNDETGISFWKMDTKNGTRILLADRLTGMGEIQEISLSHDEKKAAIVNHYGELWLLHLDN